MNTMTTPHLHSHVSTTVHSHGSAAFIGDILVGAGRLSPGGRGARRRERRGEKRGCRSD